MRIVWRWRPLVQVLAGCAYRFGVGARFHIWWCILILNKGEIKHLVVDMDFVQGWSFTFDFDKFILISNLQTTDVSFMPRVAVWISLHACLIHGFGLCIFPSHPKIQDKIQPLLQSTLRLSIHFECWEFCHKRKQEKSQDRLGKDVCNSLEIRIKLKLAPTSTLRIGTINWKFPSHKTPKCTGLYL